MQKSGFKLVFYRGNVYSFGGCVLEKECTNDLLSLFVDEMCPNNCSGNGSCIDYIGCICKIGFVSNDCSIKIQCKNECNNKGVCHNNGKCGCFPGWFGSSCESKINCPRNCTSFDNGICQADGKCLCKENFEGQDCSRYILISKHNDLNSNKSLISFSKINFNEIKSQRLNDKNFNKTLSFNYQINRKNNTEATEEKCSNHGVYDEINQKCVCYVRKILFYP